MEIRDTRDSHTAKAVLLRIREGMPELLLLEHKARVNTASQKDGKCFKERPRWGLPGGKVEDGESFATAMIRETAEETEDESGKCLNLSPEIFSESRAAHCPPKRSKRVGYDHHHDHYFFAFLPPETEIGKIREDNEEIVRGKFFALNKIPTPEDPLPFTRNQLRGLVEILRQIAPFRHIDERLLDADKWLATVEKWAFPYLTDRKTGERT